MTADMKKELANKQQRGRNSLWRIKNRERGARRERLKVPNKLYLAHLANRPLKAVNTVIIVAAVVEVFTKIVWKQ